MRSHFSSNFNQALSNPREAMAAVCNVRVFSAMLEPQLITSAPAEAIVLGWSPSKVEALVREALDEQKG